MHAAGPELAAEPTGSIRALFSVQLLHLTPYVAHPENHGGRIRTRRLLRAARDAGWRVVNVALARSAEEAEGAEALRAEGVEVRVAIVPETPSALGTADRTAKWARLVLGRSSLLPRWRHEACSRVVREVARSAAFDVVVVDTPWMDVYRRDVGRVRYVASTHNVEGDVLRDAASTLNGAAAWGARRDAAILLRFESRWVARAAGVVTVSESDARRFAELSHGARTATAPNGVDFTSMRRLGPTPAGGPMLFVGSYDYPPNADAARWCVRDLLPSIRRTAGPVELVLAGRAPGRDVLALGEVPGVVVAGAVPDLAPLYERASVVLAPLRAGGGTRLKLLEAFAYGRPVVATQAAVAGLDIENDVHYLRAEDGPQFAAAVVRLRKDPGLSARLADSARSYAESRHDWRAADRIYVAALEVARRALP